VKQQPEGQPSDVELQTGERSAGEAPSFEAGLLVGLLIAAGHLGGDARQPQITLRMHVRHRSLFHWLLGQVPGSRLYGPYRHGGREYYQWMARGAAIRDHVAPLLDRSALHAIDPPTFERFVRMRDRYAR